MDKITHMTNIALALDNPALECEQWIFIGMRKGEKQLTVLQSSNTSPGMRAIFQSVAEMLGSVHPVSDGGEIIIKKSKPNDNAES